MNTITQTAFQPIPPFKPHWMLPSGHLQTVVGCYLPQARPRYRSTADHVPLADGDILAIHEQSPPEWSPGDPVALLVHGLGGASDSCYMVRKADRLCAAGVRTFRLDLRGCGQGIGLAKGACHAGCSDDCLAALEYVLARCPDSLVSVVGFSMGGNIVLKMAGEFGDNVPTRLRNVISIAPPIDLLACCQTMRKGLARLYDRSFVGCLNQLVARRRKEAPNARHIELKSPPASLYDFDSLITAPLHGFSNVEEYYEANSSAHLLADVRVPTLIIAAADDPVIPVSIFDNVQLSSQVQLHVTDSGGHLGYVGRRSEDPDWRWLDWRLVEQIRGQRNRAKSKRPKRESLRPLSTQWNAAMQRTSAQLNNSWAKTT